MKRKAAGSIVPVVLAVALGGVKYRFDHPPLSRADTLFRQMVDQSDDVSVSWLDPTPDNCRVLVHLSKAQVVELEEKARLSDEDVRAFDRSNSAQYGLVFYQQGKSIGGE